MRLCSLLLWSICFWSSESEAKDAPKVSCKDENNKVVNMYILYKAPNSQKYIYISPKGKKLPIKDIGDSRGVLANTLRPMFDNNMPDSFGFLSYNDQPPPKTDTTDSDTTDSDRPAPFGHSKGVVLGDSETKTALWLTHSTPKFPFNRRRNSFWPENGNKNGQTFMCVTLQFNLLGVIGEHLQSIHAQTFDKRIPNSFPQEMKDAGNNIAHTPDTVPQSLRNSQPELIAVAKVRGSSATDGDLYVQLSHIFNSDMDVKPWGCQAGKDKSYCKNKYEVVNVIQVKTDLGEWKWTNDHSKWAVTTDNNIHWTCIADMNRAKSQYERPGGALCIKDQTVNGLFREFVKERRDCHNKDYEESLADDLQEMDLSDGEEICADDLHEDLSDNESVADDLQEEDLSDDESNADDLQGMDLSDDESNADDLQGMDLSDDESNADDPNKHEEL